MLTNRCLSPRFEYTGFAANAGQMANTDAVIGESGAMTATPYRLESISSSGVVPVTQNSIVTGTSFSIDAAGNAVMKFSRPLSRSGSTAKRQAAAEQTNLAVVRKLEFVAVEILPPHFVAFCLAKVAKYHKTGHLSMRAQ